MVLVRYGLRPLRDDHYRRERMGDPKALRGKRNRARRQRRREREREAKSLAARNERLTCPYWVGRVLLSCILKEGYQTKKQFGSGRVPKRIWDSARVMHNDGSASRLERVLQSEFAKLKLTSKEQVEALKRATEYVEGNVQSIGGSSDVEASWPQLPTAKPHGLPPETAEPRMADGDLVKLDRGIAEWLCHRYTPERPKKPRDHSGNPNLDPNHD